MSMRLPESAPIELSRSNRPAFHEYTDGDTPPTAAAYCVGAIGTSHGRT